METKNAGRRQRLEITRRIKKIVLEVGCRSRGQAQDEAGKE